MEDLEHFLPRAKAAQAFQMLDVDCDGQVSCSLRIKLSLTH